MYQLIAGYNATIVSPHCDDAPFSLGGGLSSGCLGTCPHIINVFTISNYTVEEPGFADVYENTIRRRNEELAAVERMGSLCDFLEFREALLRSGYSSLDDLFDQDIDVRADPVFPSVASIIQAVCQARISDLWMFPLGIGGHVDHRLLHAVACDLWWMDRSPVIAFFTDLPYAYGYDVAATVEKVSSELDSKLIPMRIGKEVLKRKLEVLSHYVSQLRQSDIEAIRKYHLSEPCEVVWTDETGARLFIEQNDESPINNT